MTGSRVVRDALAARPATAAPSPGVLREREPCARCAEALAALAREHDDADTRGESLFWISQRKSPASKRSCARLDHDASPSVRKKAVFALSQLPRERAVPALREIVESDRPRAIRKEALFWLAQTDDDEALPVFDELFAASELARRRTVRCAISATARFVALHLASPQRMQPS